MLDLVHVCDNHPQLTLDGIARTFRERTQLQVLTANFPVKKKRKKEEDSLNWHENTYRMDVITM